jgi:hypothetical protein
MRFALVRAPARYRIPKLQQLRAVSYGFRYRGGNQCRFTGGGTIGVFGINYRSGSKSRNTTRITSATSDFATAQHDHGCVDVAGADLPIELTIRLGVGMADTVSRCSGRTRPRPSC